METLYEDEFTDIYFDSTTHFLTDVWKEASKAMNADEFKTVLCQWRDLIIEHKVTNVLIDARKLHFMIEPDFQEWIAENIVGPVVKEGLKKIATLLPQTLFEQIATQQAIDEHKETIGFERRHFDDETKAKEWLSSL